MALCKIHHAASDMNMPGISPDYVVKIDDKLLEEVEWPDAASWTDAERRRRDLTRREFYVARPIGHEWRTAEELPIARGAPNLAPLPSRMHEVCGT